MQLASSPNSAQKGGLWWRRSFFHPLQGSRGSQARARSLRLLGLVLLVRLLFLVLVENTEVVISLRPDGEDDVVPVAPVLDLAREQSLPILVVPDGHRLENSLDRVVSEFRGFLQTCLSDMNQP